MTGSSRGIAAAFAERLARDGLGVVINDSGDPGSADQLVGNIVARGGKAVAVEADVADGNEVTALFDAAQNRVRYPAELARWGIETMIVVPGSFTSGTNHFEDAGKPFDEARAKAYADGPTGSIGDQALKGLTALAPPDADPEDVARAIVRVIDTPFGQRPFRVTSIPPMTVPRW